MRISIIGAGYVGRNIGSVLDRQNHEIIFYDIDPNVKKRLIKNKMTVARNIKEAVHGTDCSYICVPTPTGVNGKIILKYLLSAVGDCGRSLKSKNGKHVIIIKSTIIPGTTKDVIIPLLERVSNKKYDVDFGVVFNPEFVTEINESWTKDKGFEVTPYKEHRIVIGEGDNKKWPDILIRNIYSKLKSPIIRTDYNTAEFIKYASNCILATKISYWNEIFLICDKLGVDSRKIADAVSLDPRIGKYGTVHGKAFGGKCLPKDLKAFIQFSKNISDIRLLKAVDRINEYMKDNYGVRE